MREASSLLTRLKADDSNDDYDDTHNLDLQRERWLRKLIGGLIPTVADLSRQLRLYRFSAQLGRALRAGPPWPIHGRFLPG